MKYQEFIQDKTKVINFNLNQDISDSNSQISLIDDKVSKTQDSESLTPALMVGLLIIFALAYIIGLVFVVTNLIIKVIIKVDQDGHISSEFYEQTRTLMRLNFEEHSYLV